MIAISRFIVAATDKTEPDKAFAPYRGKCAKEVYRCVKGIFITRKILKPILFAGAQIVTEVPKGAVTAAALKAGECAIGYICGVGFIRSIYVCSHAGKVKNATRLVYNIACLPVTIYTKGANAVFDGIGIGYLEEKWFGERVYIFNDDRVWIERNFTASEILKAAEKIGGN